jgi:hypothetical protein
MTVATGRPVHTAVSASRSTVLRLKIDVASPLLRSAMSAFWQSGEPGARYVDYLRTMHTILRASVPLMELAARRCAVAADDPSATALRSYLLEHIAEELHHDEWIVDDLRAVDRRPSPLLDEQPAPAVAALVGAQYYWINHHDPVCLLGYIAVLESHRPSARLRVALRAATGFPDAAFRTLDHHADVDGLHIELLYRLLDGLQLAASQDTAISVSALHAATALTGLFIDGARRAPAARPLISRGAR